MSSKSLPPRLSEGELEIMQVVWADKPLTVREAADALNAKRSDSVARTTVLKQMQRLEEKGWIRRLGPERPAKFQATVPERTAMRRIARSFQARAFGGSPVAVVRQLLDGATLTTAEISELEKIVREAASHARGRKC
jgi:BlaI family penicillinase repressor